MLTASKRSGGSSSHKNPFAVTSCIQATLFHKIDEMEFPPLGGHIRDQKFICVACLAVQSSSSGASEGYDHEPVAIGDGASANRGSRGMRCRLGYRQQNKQQRRQRNANRRARPGIAPERRNAECEGC